MFWLTLCHMQLITAALHFKLWNLKHPFFLFFSFFYYKLKCHKRVSHNLNVGVFFYLHFLGSFWIMFSLLAQGRISRGRTAVCLCSYSLQSSTLKQNECLCFRNAHLKRWIVDHFILFFFLFFFWCWRNVTRTQLLNKNCLPASWRLFQKHFAIFNCHRITRKCHSV